jgi:hypothetical protein
MKRFFKTWRDFLFTIALFIAILSVTKCDPVKEKYITSSLYAKWTETPFLLEAR